MLAGSGLLLLAAAAGAVVSRRWVRQRAWAGVAVGLLAVLAGTAAVLLGGSEPVVVYSGSYVPLSGCVGACSPDVLGGWSGSQLTGGVVALVGGLLAVGLSVALVTGGRTPRIGVGQRL